MSETFIRVKRIIIAVIGSAERDVNPSASLDELGIGSLDLLELGMALEEEFDVMIMDEYLLSSKTVGDLVETVHNARARQKCSSGAAVRQPQARTCARPALCWPFQISRFRMFQLPPKRSK
ncbi:acyl carrier protein [Martelella limonii]|uniref:acyl carrier protein n=1 Tax=Martelella limonii TaxID=1647649 RepID=UPI001580EE26|nr:acyl carrier protein [Martelella limonii]